MKPRMPPPQNGDAKNARRKSAENISVVIDKDSITDKMLLVKIQNKIFRQKVLHFMMYCVII